MKKLACLVALLGACTTTTAKDGVEGDPDFAATDDTAADGFGPFQGPVEMCDDPFSETFDNNPNHFWSFETDGCDDASINLESDDGDTYLLLYKFEDDDWRIIARNDDCRGTLNSCLDRPLEAGRYLIGASTYDYIRRDRPSTATYQLDMTCRDAGYCDDSGTLGETCGDADSVSCDEGQFCNIPESNICGTADGTGICETIPETCDSEDAPVCGCDEETYDNACSAAAASMSVQHDGACALVEDAGRLSVVIAGSRGGEGNVVSDVSINCGATCSETIEYGNDVTLMAVAAAGSQFVGFESSDGTVCAAMADCTITISEDTIVTARFSANPIITLSGTDRDSDVRLRYDNMAADLHEEFGGVRSSASIAPGSGVFYVEGRRLTDRRGSSGIAVTSGTLDLEGTFCGATDQSFGIATGGGINYDDSFQGIFQGSATEYYGFIVDYRDTNPTVYLIVHDWNDRFTAIVPQIRMVRTLSAVTTDLYFMACGGRAIVGSEIEVNPGNDTTNFPFHYDPAALLRADSRAETDPAFAAVADELVLGWGQTFAGAVDAPPAITATADVTLTLGETANLSATAIDAEDGELTVQWELLASGYYLARVTEDGPTFSFTPGDEGVHQVRAWAYDSAGHMSEHIINVTIADALPQYDPVQLTPDALTGTGIILSSDGLSARFTGPGKMGIRANQGLLTEFQYFEATRLHAPVNMGSGIVVQYGNLNPFGWNDVPQSLVINMQGATWQNLIPHVFSLGDAYVTETYGYAVDYRGATPIVYVITDDGLVDTLELYDTTTPVYPMLYGNPTSTAPGEFDESLNFGGSAFAYDASGVLSAAGIDVAEFEVGWGDANTP